MFIEKFNCTKVFEIQMLTEAYLEDSVEAQVDHTYSLWSSQHLNQETNKRVENLIFSTFCFTTFEASTLPSLEQNDEACHPNRFDITMYFDKSYHLLLKLIALKRSFCEKANRNLYKDHQY